MQAVVKKRSRLTGAIMLSRINLNKRMRDTGIILQIVESLFQG